MAPTFGSEFDFANLEISAAKWRCFTDRVFHAMPVDDEVYLAASVYFVPLFVH